MEFDKEQLEQAWQERFEREQKYLELLSGLHSAKKKELLNTTVYTTEYWHLEIELFDLETNIKTKEHYIESMKNDKAQQQSYQDAKMKFIEDNASDVMKKARVCIDRKTDRASVLEALTKEMPKRETPEWYARIWEINEHVRAAKVPTTESIKLEALK